MKKKIAIPCFFVLVALLLFSLLWHQRLVEEEKEFANYLLIREGGMYTLVGSKPISEFHIEKGTAAARKRDLERDLPVQYFSASEIEVTDGDAPFDTETVTALWKGWQRRHKINNQKYALVTVAYEETVDHRIDWIYFVNKVLVKATLIQYYPLFTEQVGSEFDIDEVMAKIDDLQSFFWQKILPMDKLNHVAAGIFFGYGLENAIGFEEARKNAEPSIAMPSVSLVERLRARWKKKISLRELPLPMFGEYSTGDNQVELYKREREQIRKDYEGKDLRKLLLAAFK